MSVNLGSLEEISVKDDFMEIGCTREAFTEVDEVIKLIEDVKNIYEDSIKAEIALTNFTKLLSSYQLQPHLLDGHLDDMLGRLITVVKDGQSSMKLKHEAFKYLVVISHVRGYKTVVRLLPHEVSDLEPVLGLLAVQDKSDIDTWATRYMLLLWLSIIVMIPFHMSRLDSFSSSEAHGRQTAMQRIFDMCKQYMLVLDSCNRPAAFLTSRFITRSDVRDLYMAEFFTWATTLEGNPPTGVLAAVCWVFKHGKREDVLPYAPSLLRWAQSCTQKEKTFSLTHKFAMKLVQRIGLTFLKPRLAHWRYQRGNRSLADNLKVESTARVTSDVRAAVKVEEEKKDKDESEEDFDVPEELEEVVEELMQGLRHQDIIVRWSAAKGVGRLTGRLPRELGDEVVGSVLSIMNAREVPHAWHGGCLALAELGRRGLLLPSRLPEVVPIVLKALAFDEKRANLPVGAVIRDSACYVCWSFARAYDKEVLTPYINAIASALLVVIVFDREINCRRAASAAYQENVGRQGAFPHGLDIITVADFFAVGIRNNAFLNISVYIAQFEEYTAPLIDHLLQKKVDHWDIAIRELAAKALHNLTHLAPGYMVANVLPELLRLSNSIDLYGRHGAIMALGEVLAALASCLPNEKPIENALGAELLSQIQKLVPSMRERQQFMGMGGDLMRQAVSSFIKNASSANLPFHKHQVIDDWQWVLTDSLSQVDPLTRSRAVEALPAFCDRYYKDESGPLAARQTPLITLFVSQLVSSTQTTRMGFSLALGALPAFMFEGCTSEVITALCICSQTTEQTSKWAESRRDALIALAAVCSACGTTQLEGADGWYRSQCDAVFRHFLEGLRDYTRDSRGDVGAWVREAAMAGLQILVQLVLVAEPCQLTEELMREVVGLVAQNAIERIDRTRKQAGCVFSSLLHSSPENSLIPHRAKLVEIFPPQLCKEVNWGAEVQTFPLFTQMLALPAYTHHMLLGLVASVGGVTESLVKHSSSSLFSYLRQQSRPELQRLCDCIIEVFRQNQGVDLITLPLLRFLDRILNSGVLSTEDGTLPENFAVNLTKLLIKETAKCSAPIKLIEAIPVFCQIASIRAEKKASTAALSHLVIYLCHKFPRVRTVTAEQLYEAMIQEDEGFGDEVDMETVLTLLSDTNWTDETVDKLRPIRNQLCDLLNIPKPKIVQRVVPSVPTTSNAP